MKTAINIFTLIATLFLYMMIEQADSVTMAYIFLGFIALAMLSYGNNSFRNEP